MRTAALPAAASSRSRDMRIYRQNAARRRQNVERGIHLVRVSAAGIETPAELHELGDVWLAQENARLQRRLRLAAMSLGAAFAPGVWLIHALFTHLHLF